MIAHFGWLRLRQRAEYRCDSHNCLRACKHVIRNQAPRARALILPLNQHLPRCPCMSVCLFNLLSQHHEHISPSLSEFMFGQVCVFIFVCSWFDWLEVLSACFPLTSVYTSLPLSVWTPKDMSTFLIKVVTFCLNWITICALFSQLIFWLCILWSNWWSCVYLQLKSLRVKHQKCIHSSKIDRMCMSVSLAYSFCANLI